MQRAAPRLEEIDDLIKVGERAQAGAGIVAVARQGKARVALLAAGGQRHNLVAPLRPAGRTERDGDGKADVMEGGKGHGLLVIRAVTVGWS